MSKKTQETQINQVNQILESCSLLFAIMKPFKAHDRGAGIATDYKETIMSGFDSLEQTAYELKINGPTIKETKYAMAAFVDEIILCSDWSERTLWMSNPLQLQFFGEHLAGEGFFKHLAKLRQAGSANTDIIELYYVCLQLGFEGVYRLQGMEQLMALQVDLRSQLEDYKKIKNRVLSPTGLPESGFISHMRREVPNWAISVFTVAIIFFTYMGYSMIIENQSENGVKDILAYQDKMDPRKSYRSGASKR
ncbi:MAG: type IVB secretion system protein IcmH/DotU [Gammaproteobacteria bacterium]